MATTDAEFRRINDGLRALGTRIAAIESHRMAPSESGEILDELRAIRGDVADLRQVPRDLAEVKGQLTVLNGQVRQNAQEIAVLKATSLNLNAVKLSAIVGAVVVGIEVISYFLGNMLP